MKGIRRKGTPRSRQQGARGSRAKGQRAEEGAWPWTHGLIGVPREGIGMTGRCSLARHPSSHPAISTTTLPCDADDVPTPASVPGPADASTRTTAPSGRWDGVGSAGREGRRAQEGMGEDRGKGEEAVGEGGKGHGRGGQDGGAVDRGAEAQAVEELQQAWAELWRRQGRVERAEREGGWHGEGGRQEGRPPLMPFRQPAIPPEQESEMQERAWRRIRGEVARLAEKDREVAALERRVQEGEEAVAQGVHRVLPDPEGDTLPGM